MTVTVSGQSGSLANGFTYVAIPTVTSVSPNTGVDSGRNIGHHHRHELCLWRNGDVWNDSGNQRGCGEQHDDHGDYACRKRGRSDGNDNGQRAEW